MYLECFIDDGLWLKKNNLLNFKVENNTWGASVLFFHCIILIYNSKRLAKISWKIKTSSFVKKKKIRKKKQIGCESKKNRIVQVYYGNPWLRNDWKQNTINTESELFKFCLQKKVDPVYLPDVLKYIHVYSNQRNFVLVNILKSVFFTFSKSLYGLNLDWCPFHY